MQFLQVAFKTTNTSSKNTSSENKNPKTCPTDADEDELKPDNNITQLESSTCALLPWEKNRYFARKRASLRFTANLNVLSVVFNHNPSDASSSSSSSSSSMSSQAWQMLISNVEFQHCNLKPETSLNEYQSRGIDSTLVPVFYVFFDCVLFVTFSFHVQDLWEIFACWT
jgi:hypothetical protein